MNDFFTPESETDAPAMSTTDEAAIREKIQAEIFEGVPAKFDDLETAGDADDPSSSPDDTSTPDVDSQTEGEIATEIAEEVIPPDVPPVLSPEMQAIVDSVNKLTNNITGMEDRLKQNERRVGGITNEFHNAKTAAAEAAANQAKAPTPEEMAVAAKDEAAWEDLKKDFPSWADAISSKLRTQTANFVSVDAFEELRASVSNIPAVDTNQLETRLVGLIHPDHKQIVADPAYATWLNVQSDELKFKAYQGKTAEEAIDVFNQFKTDKATAAVVPAPASDAPSEVEQIKAQRKKQLEASTTTNTNHKTIKQKTEDDMTEPELRAHIADKVFAPV